MTTKSVAIMLLVLLYLSGMATGIAIGFHLAQAFAKIGA